MEELQLPDGFRNLSRRLWRGGIIFHSLRLVFAGCAGGALFIGFFFHGWIPWAIVAFIMSLVCRLTALLHVGRRYISAWKVAENPQIVYWGHSINQQGQATDLVVTESNKLKLHLKDGTQLNVEAVRGTGISQEQLRKSSPGFAGKTLPCDGGTTTNLASEQPT